MRLLKHPENYASGKDSAAMLRQIADDLEKRGDMINVHVQLWFASKMQVDASIKAKEG